MINKFLSYLEDHFMDYDVVEPIVKIGDDVYIYVSGDDRVIDDNLQLILNPSEEQMATKFKAKDPEYVFEWGGRYYSRPCNKWDEPIFNPFFYRGKVFADLDIDFINLGVHGRYELMNGTRDYSDWCKKAKFFGQDALGICEKNTLAGTLAFQMACDRSDIKSIIGETLRVDAGTRDYLIKLYVANGDGWKNLLNFNKIANIDNAQFIEEDDITRSNGRGLICVLMPTKHIGIKLIQKLKQAFDDVYFQIDLSEYEYDIKELESLESIKFWYNNHMDDIKPVLIGDSYYLEKEDARIKKELNKSGVKGEFLSHNQHYKHIEELWFEWEELWTEDGRSDMISIFKKAVRNTGRIVAQCDFSIDTSQIHIPKYEMTEDELSQYGSNEEMIDALILDGVDRLIEGKGYDMDGVWDRIHYEMSVIRKGGFTDYFLITRDIVNWSQKNNIITGIGRGSAAGCLVSYLLGIVLMNPLDYDLLFERFLNESRIGGSMPDIDLDFSSDGRDDVKRYMESRFGDNNVASIGTYVTLQLKAAFQEMCRVMNIKDTGTRNYLSSMLDDYNSWEELFVAATERPQFKNLILNHGELINNIQLCLNSPKSQGVHACATVVVPKHDKDGNETSLFDYVPMRKTSEGMLVTEWEGPQMEDAGFLKEDILGLKQLDKFQMIFRLIKDNGGDDLIDMWVNQTVPLDDELVWSAFSEGHTSDVFQFSGDGMTKFLKKMKPDSLEDLIAAAALYRPGPMGSNAHNDYCDLKNGKKDPEYDWGCEHITKNTYGLIVYQEQVMKICQDIGGFTLVEADNIRKAMGKKKKDLLDSFKEKFIEGAINNDCPEKDAVDLWEKMEIFSAYAFNKSHSAVYAKTAYWCQWLKVNYPVQFWTTALTYAKDEKIPPFISEILEQELIEVMPPDINSSQESFIPNMERNEIYWSLSKISHLGDASVNKILEDRDKGGKYFELSEFISRTNSNKRVVVNLILSGSFDLMYDVEKKTDRLRILKEFFKIRKEEMPDEFKSGDVKYEWFWYLQQKKVSGLAHLSSFQKVMDIKITPETYPLMGTFTNGVGFHTEEAIGKNLLVGGYVVEVEERKTKKGDFYAKILLDCNYVPIKITVWPDSYLYGMKEKLKGSSGKIMFFNGKVIGPDRWNDTNTMVSIGEGFKGSDAGKISKIDIVG